ncbi:hypothetical protein GCM10017710_35950 [Arthrobacter ramosus]
MWPQITRCPDTGCPARRHMNLEAGLAEDNADQFPDVVIVFYDKPNP